MDTETLQIHLNSKNAMYFNGSISDCEWVLPCIEVPQQHTIYCSVQHAIIPYTFYNIDKNNNRLDYTINNITTSLNISYGNYNPYNLITFLQNNLSQMSITYNVITNKLTFTNSTYDFTFLGSSTCLSLLGFSISTASINKILVSTNCINLQSHMCICLATNLPTGHINNSNKFENNILVSIPIDNNPFSMITYTNYNNLKSNLYKNTLGTIQIKLIDQDNNLIDLNGCHWSITIQLDVVKFV